MKRTSPAVPAVPADAPPPRSRRAPLLQFVKFGIVGVSNTLVSLAVCYGILLINKSGYMVYIAQIAGWVVSVGNAFFWNNRFVFRQKDNTLRRVAARLLRTYVAYAASMALSIALSYGEINLLHISEWLVPVINLPLTIPLNFIINKKWTFRK